MESKFNLVTGRIKKKNLSGRGNSMLAWSQLGWSVSWSCGCPFLPNTKIVMRNILRPNPIIKNTYSQLRRKKTGTRMH
jgi:hypothetical protein